MWALDNRTPFAAALLPWTDPAGVEQMFVAVKATFHLAASPTIADAQAPVELTDAYDGAPGRAWLVKASELGPIKQGTDIALLGSAWAPRGGAASLAIAMRVGPVRRAARVFGDREWKRGLTGLAPGAPQPFAVMPLTPARAFGGVDRSADDPDAHEEEARNPVGLGFLARRSRLAVHDAPLPNIEDERELLAAPDDRPAPALLGFVAPSWQPRRAFAGTYDQAWRDERAPLAPVDLDPRFFHAVAPESVARPHLRGGEPVRLVGVVEEGTLDLSLPSPRLQLTAVAFRRCVALRPALETIVLDTDARRISMTWKAAVTTIALYDLDLVQIAGEAGA